MSNIDAMIEARDNRLLNEYLAKIDAYDHFVDWCEERDLDTDDEESQSLYNAEMEAQDEDWAVQQYESRMEDRAMENYPFR
jgi:transcription elongation factor Elf1